LADVGKSDDYFFREQIHIPPMGKEFLIFPNCCWISYVKFPGNINYSPQEKMVDSDDLTPKVPEDLTSHDFPKHFR